VQESKGGNPGAEPAAKAAELAQRARSARPAGFHTRLGLALARGRAGPRGAEGRYIPGIEERRGTLTKLEADRATLTLEDGTEVIVSAPEMVYAEIGMTVIVCVADDGTVTVRWGLLTAA
jgi:hypothetical protein